MHRLGVIVPVIVKLCEPVFSILDENIMNSAVLPEKNTLLHIPSVINYYLIDHYSINSPEKIFQVSDPTVGRKIPDEHT